MIVLPDKFQKSLNSLNEEREKEMRITAYGKW
jgi:hypothetical protein